MIPIEQDTPIVIYVLTKNKLLTFHQSKTKDFKELMEMFSILTGSNLNSLKFVFGRIVIDADDTPQQYDMHSGDIIKCYELLNVGNILS